MSPRNFSAEERDALRYRAIEVATRHFARYGYRKANVGEIAREVGIGKGTLYLFFGSKAKLFVGAVTEVERDLRARLMKEMRMEHPTARQRIRRFFELQRGAFSDQPLLAVLLDPAEASALMRDLPPDTVEELRISDETFFGALAEELRRDGRIASVEPEVLAALPRALYAIDAQREMIGAEVFPDVAELVVESLVAALTPAEDT